MRARLIRSLEAGLVGALVAGLWEAARSGVWAPSFAVWLLLAPLVAGVVVFADLALRATPTDPHARSASIVLVGVGAALTATLLGAVLGRLAGVFHNLDLLGPATVVVATAVVTGAAGVGFILRAPLTIAWSRLAPRVGLALAGVVALGAVVLAVRGPALTLGKGASPWPFVFLGAALTSGLLWAVARRNAARWWPAALVALTLPVFVASAEWGVSAMHRWPVWGWRRYPSLVEADISQTVATLGTERAVTMLAVVVASGIATLAAWRLLGDERQSTSAHLALAVVGVALLAAYADAAAHFSLTTLLWY